MGWLPQFLWTDNDTNNHLDILVNRLRTLGAQNQLPGSPLKDLFDCLNLIKRVAQKQSTLLTQEDITNQINNVIINVTRIQALLYIGGNIIREQTIHDRQNAPLRVTLIQTIATLGTWCYKQRKNLTPDLIFVPDDDYALSLTKFVTAFRSYFMSYSEAESEAVVFTMKLIYNNFNNHYMAAKYKRNSGILGALLGSGITLAIILITGGPLWLLIGAPLLGGFASSHLMEYRSKTLHESLLYPAPHVNDINPIMGGSSAQMGPIRPTRDPKSPHYFDGMTGDHSLEIDPEPSPDLERIKAKAAASLAASTSASTHSSRPH